MILGGGAGRSPVEFRGKFQSKNKFDFTTVGGLPPPPSPWPPLPTRFFQFKIKFDVTPGGGGVP